MIVNLTSHEFRVVRFKKAPEHRHHGRLLAKPEDLDVIRVIEPSGTVVRCGQTATRVGTLFGIPVRQVTDQPVQGLPEPDGKTIYVVSSRMVNAAAESGRTSEDLISPYLVVRNVDNPGVVLGTVHFQTLSNEPLVHQQERLERNKPKRQPKYPRAIPDKPIRSFLPFPVNLVTVDQEQLEQGDSELFYAQPENVRPLVTLKPSGVSARRTHSTFKATERNGVMVHPMSYGKVNQLPEPDGETINVVSGSVFFGALKTGRTTDDLLMPGGTVRLRTDESVSQGQMFLDTTSVGGLLARMLDK